ncbi:hypothetical protein Y032_0015g2661 [Ancylostoma ceylanicum]|uniref:Uncharacterized protein n=1 Tax=Ancylostoma ceylanicum TaxID=53326 RepID=A0A016V7Q5_9BILA|nr:hypothetical protein Y032_0015g2661 [Ancylostoma ceylanicum]
MKETKWSGNKSKDISHGFKVVYNDSSQTRNGVGIVVSQRYRDSIAGVKRFDDSLMKEVIAIAEQHLHFFSALAPQTKRKYLRKTHRCRRRPNRPRRSGKGRRMRMPWRLWVRDTE